MYSSVGGVLLESVRFVTVVLFSLWLLAPDSFSKSAQSDSRFRRGWGEESRPLWPLLVAHLFIWNGKNFRTRFFLRCGAVSLQRTGVLLSNRVLSWPLAKVFCELAASCLNRLMIKSRRLAASSQLSHGLLHFIFTYQLFDQEALLRLYHYLS